MPIPSLPNAQAIAEMLRDQKTWPVVARKLADMVDAPDIPPSLAAAASEGPAQGAAQPGAPSVVPPVKPGFAAVPPEMLAGQPVQENIRPGGSVNAGSRIQGVTQGSLLPQAQQRDPAQTLAALLLGRGG
jgi:hypothetical protein